MAIWGAKHLDAGLVLVHDVCETPIEMTYYCPQCDTQIEAGESSYRKRAGGAGRTGRQARRAR
jgi:hypothetical protein